MMQLIITKRNKLSNIFDPIVPNLMVSASKMEALTEGHRQMRTFIFGAGTSFHAGYPLASKLWHEMERWARATFDESHNFRAAVEQMNAEFDLSKSFELVLTDLDNRIEPLCSKRQASSAADFVNSTTPESLKEWIGLVHLKAMVRDMIPRFFNSLSSHAAESYMRFAHDVLTEGDVVITFNYDLALDRELKRSGKWDIANGYGFAIGDITPANLPDSPCKLLKLHGSVNWVGEPFQGTRGFRQVDLANLSLGHRPTIDSPSFERDLCTFASARLKVEA
jgi:hypothetical protein